MWIGGSGASLIVWHESTTTGFKSISDFEALLTDNGSTFRSTLSVPSFRSTFAVEFVVALLVDWETIGWVTATLEFIVSGAILSMSTSTCSGVLVLPTLIL